MSTSIQQSEIEAKQQDTYSGKDDQKQQAALSKKQTKQTDAPVDSGSSLIGGTISAVQHAVDRGIDMLPASLQTRAHTLEETAKHALDKAAVLAAPVVEAYQHDGIIAAAKTAGSVGTHAAKDAATTLKATVASKKEAKAELKADKKEAKADLKADKKSSKIADLQKSAVDTAANLQKSATATASNLQKTAATKAGNLQASAIQLKDQAIGAAMNLKERVLPAGEQAAPAAAPKKHGRRRRGGRGHGNRKMKTRVLAEKEVESITDTLGEKAKELKEVIVEAPAASSSSSSSGGLVQNIRSSVSGIATNLTSTATGLASSAQAKATGVVAGAQAKAAQLTGSAKQILNETTKSNKLERKPSLQRRDELPALGTPMTPEETVTRTADGKLASKPDDQSSLLDKAKFAVGGVVEATRDFVADKLDNVSMNADDTKPLDKSDKAALKQATKQLDNLKQATKQ